MKPDYKRIPCSIIAEGTATWGPFDRGDAAMYADGALRFALAYGDRAVAEELWKGIAWSLEYCRRQQTPAGVIASDRDELEGRLPTGKANLTTSSLCYGGLRSAANLARAWDKKDEAAEYDRRGDALAKAIGRYFEATVDGFDTYRYYDGNDRLRSWICMPLSMGHLRSQAGHHRLALLLAHVDHRRPGIAVRRQSILGPLHADVLRAVFQAGSPLWR